MKITLMERMKRAYPYRLNTPRHVTKHNRRQWIRSIKVHLNRGADWVVLSKETHVQRLQDPVVQQIKDNSAWRTVATV